MKRKTRRPARPFGDTLIIVDLQRAFTVPPKLVTDIEAYSRRFKRRVFTRFENPPGSIFRRLMKMDSCPPGSTDVVLYIQPERGDIVFGKRGYGLSASQVARLKREGVKKAVVCGIDTDACVLGVMFSLFDRGIDCRANRDLCFSTSGSEMHEAAMKVIERQFPPPRRAGK